MASKSVGLFVLFHLVVLNVVSQSSAFPTPTASADGEWDVASAAQLTFTVVVLKCYCRKPTVSVVYKEEFKAHKVHKTLFFIRKTLKTGCIQVVHFVLSTHGVCRVLQCFIFCFSHLNLLTDTKCIKAVCLEFLSSPARLGSARTGWLVACYGRLWSIFAAV